MPKRTTGVHQAADGAWKVDKIHKGSRLQKRFGPDQGQEAEDWLLEQLARRVAERQRPQPRRTFEQAAAHYLTLYEHKKLSIKEEAAWLEEMMPFIGKLPLDRIYDGTLGAFVKAQQEKPIKRGRATVRVGLKSKSINLKLGLIRHILILAARSWRDEDGEPWLSAAPLITMLAGGDEREPRQLTWQEQRDYLQGLPDHLASMALFDLNTGVREEVVCGLRWAWEVKIPELDIVTFIVPADYVKGQRGKKRARVIVCNSVAREVVEAQRGRHDEFVFVYQRNRDRAGSLGTRRPNYEPKPPAPVQTMNNTAWQKWRERCGLGDLHVHDLRHTVGMRLREAGVAEETRADILWHTRKGMPQHYAVAQIVEIFGALQKIRDEQNAFNKSLASIAREQSGLTTKVTTKKNAA